MYIEGVCGHAPASKFLLADRCSYKQDSDSIDVHIEVDVVITDSAYLYTV